MNQRTTKSLVGGSLALLVPALAAWNLWHDAEHRADPLPEVVPQGTVWVANEDGGSLSVIDARTNTVVTTVDGIAQPHNVQTAPDGRRVYADPEAPHGTGGHAHDASPTPGSPTPTGHSAPDGSGMEGMDHRGSDMAGMDHGSSDMASMDHRGSDKVL